MSTYSVVFVKKTTFLIIKNIISTLSHQNINFYDYFIQNIHITNPAGMILLNSLKKVVHHKAVWG
jgi:hypothetical protein